MDEYSGYLDQGAYDTFVVTDDTSHVTGNQNSNSKTGVASLGVGTVQWLIVVGALAALWLLYFGFRSDIKVG